jgi:hypothetical protein
VVGFVALEQEKKTERVVAKVRKMRMVGGATHADS